MGKATSLPSRSLLTDILALLPPVPLASTRPTFSTLFETALSLPGPSSSELAPKEPDSDVSWLQVDPSSLDGLMASRSGTQADQEGKMDLDLSLPEDERDGEEVDDGGLGKMADRVGKFVGAEGRLEGAVFDEYVFSH